MAKGKSDRVFTIFRHSEYLVGLWAHYPRSSRVSFIPDLDRLCWVIWAHRPANRPRHDQDLGWVIDDEPEKKYMANFHPARAYKHGPVDINLCLPLEQSHWILPSQSGRPSSTMVRFFFLDSWTTGSHPHPDWRRSSQARGWWNWRSTGKAERPDEPQPRFFLRVRLDLSSRWSARADVEPR